MWFRSGGRVSVLPRATGPSLGEPRMSMQVVGSVAARLIARPVNEARVESCVRLRLLISDIAAEESSRLARAPVPAIGATGRVVPGERVVSIIGVRCGELRLVYAAVRGCREFAYAHRAVRVPNGESLRYTGAGRMRNLH
jgi:hypothetical protein